MPSSCSHVTHDLGGGGVVVEKNTRFFRQALIAVLSFVSAICLPPSHMARESRDARYILVRRWWW